MPNEERKRFGYNPNFQDLLRSIGTKLGTEQKPIDIGLKETVNVEPTWGKHPHGVPESIKEKIIKYAAPRIGTMLSNEDMPYLEQYLHPEYDILPKQELRPTIGKSPNIPFRHADTSVQIFTPKDYSSKFMEILNKESPSHKFNKGGLGKYKFDERNPNYNSIYDVWDFNTNTPMMKAPTNKLESNSLIRGLDYVAKEIMKRVGQPYAVYERVPKSSKWTEPTSSKLKVK